MKALALMASVVLSTVAARRLLIRNVDMVIAHIYSMFETNLFLLAQGAAAQAAPASSSQVTFTLITSLATLAAAIFGFLKAQKELLAQKKELAEQKELLTQQRTDLSAFKQAFTNLQALRTALCKPLEGLWAIRIPYARFHNNTTEEFFLNGTAIFLWRGPSAPRGYDIYFGAHITRGVDREQLVAVFCQLRLSTDEGGMPTQPFQTTGRYLSRVSKDQAAAQPGTNLEAFEYRDGNLETDSDGNVISITLQFNSAKSSGPVIFTR